MTSTLTATGYLVDEIISPAKSVTESGSIIELGLSLVDQGYSPQWSTSGGDVQQTTNTNVLQHVLRRAKMPRSLYHSAGKSGDTVTGALARFAEEVAAVSPRPDVVAYLNGGNDINTISVAADIETVLTTMQRDFESTWESIKKMGSELWLQALPDNGTWSARRNESSGSFGSAYYRYHCFWRWHRYCMEFARRHNIKFANLARAFSYQARQIPKTATSISVTSNVATARVVGHGYSVGDTVYNTTASDATWLLTTGATILTVGAPTADDFTYSFTHANGSAASPGAFVRGNTIAGLWSDAPSNIHFNPSGATKGSYATYEGLITGTMDTLSFCEGDAENLVGVGIASVTDQNVLNRGMLSGTSGSRVTAGGGSHSGNVGTGWTCEIVTGNASTVVMHTQPSRTALDQTHMQDQQMAITAGSANCEIVLRMDHALPTARAMNTAYSVGNWVRPSVQTEYFYVCVAAGTSHASTEPTWPTTPGDVVTDGTAKWECRRGWINDGATQYRLGAEYTISALSSSSAILSMAFGLWDESVSANSITDGNHVQNTVGMLYTAGENGYFNTPEGVIAAGMTAPRVALKLWIKSGTTCTIKLGRASWYRTDADA
jgi:hypothetical protein